jgi:DNA-binding transcriptional regulator LsrR (DeoR family)
MRVKVILDKEKIDSMYHYGMTQREIAQSFGINRSTISQFMKKHGIKVRIYLKGTCPRAKLVRALDKEKIASMYESGMTQVQIGEAFGLPNSYISTFMKEHNIKARNGKEQQKVIKNGK